MTRSMMSRSMMSRSIAALALLTLLMTGCGQAPRAAAPLLGSKLGAQALCPPGECGTPKPVPTCNPRRPLGPEAICPPGECGTPKPTPCR